MPHRAARRSLLSREQALTQSSKKRRIVGPYTRALHIELLEYRTLLAVASLPAIADAYVFQGVPDQKYGQSEQLDIWDHDTLRARSFVKFDLSSIPAGSSINSASLRLNVIIRQFNDNFIVQPVAQPWIENEVTWETRPALVDNILAEVEAASLGWRTISDSRLTDQARAWFNGTQANHGFGLVATNNSDSQLSFTSRESTLDPTPDPNPAPKLIVDYTPADPNDQIVEAIFLGPMTNDRSATLQSIDNGTDVDMFSFSVSAGQRIAFDTDRPSSALDSYIRLFNSSGTQLDFSNNDSAPNELFSTTDSWLEYTFNTAGTYYLGVSGAGNSAYNPISGAGDGNGSTGAYNLYLSVTGGLGFLGISGVVTDGNETFDVSIQQHGSSNAGIDPILRTWVVTHGLNSSRNNSNIVAVAIAVDGDQLDDQVLTLDWSSAAAGSFPYFNEDWIPIVAQWAANALVNHGFLGAMLNLVGHSWGSYVSAELAERLVGGVNTIVGLDPAENTAGSWNPNDPGEIDFGRDSAFSWAFHSDLVGPDEGHEDTPTTADEAIVVTNSSHGDVVFLFADMIENPTGGVSQLFQLDRLLNHEAGPWIIDRFDHNGATQVNGKYEAVMTAASGGRSPESITYIANGSGQSRSVFETDFLGDYNRNNIVDAADYVVWRNTSGSTTNVQADGSGNGIVDQADYDLWRANFGNTLPQPGNGAGEAIALAEPAAHANQPPILPHIFRVARLGLPAMVVALTSSRRDNHALRRGVWDVPPVVRHDGLLTAWLESQTNDHQNDDPSATHCDSRHDVENDGEGRNLETVDQVFATLNA